MWCYSLFVLFLVVMCSSFRMSLKPIVSSISLGSYCHIGEAVMGVSLVGISLCGFVGLMIWQGLFCTVIMKATHKNATHSICGFKRMVTGKVKGR